MDYAIKLENVSKSFRGNNILKDINLTIMAGRTVGIIGSNGCGKSVIFKLMCGLERADIGEVFVNGEKLGKEIDFPKEVGIFINSPGYVEIYSGYKNLEFLYGINKKIDKDKIRNTMELVGLDPDNKTKVKNYSLGMKQKLGIAQAIMENQSIIILDEPFNSLDKKTYEDTKRIINTLQKEGKTILLTSHNYEDIERLCNDIYILHDKRLHVLTEELKNEYLRR